LVSSADINVLKAGTKEELGIEMFDVRSLTGEIMTQRIRGVLALEKLEG